MVHRKDANWKMRMKQISRRLFRRFLWSDVHGLHALGKYKCGDNATSAGHRGNTEMLSDL